MKSGKPLSMGNAPFAFNKRTSASLIWAVVLTLIPATAWGLYRYGSPAAIILCSAIGGSLAGEALAMALRKRFTLWDGSAFLTGLLVGLAMPPSISPLIPAASAFFASAVVKGAFGGLGSNWMNPALAGVAFALTNWSANISDAVSAATPIALARAHGGFASLSATPLDISITDSLNQNLFSLFGANLPAGYIDLILGNKMGAIGELSGLLILAASIVLLARKMIRWEIPASIVASFALLSWIFGGLPQGQGLFGGDVLFSLFSGSFLLVAFFMAPDPVTSPSSSAGMLLYGIGIGAVTFLLRNYGWRSEGTAFAVLIMDCAVPALAKLDTAILRWRTSRPEVPALSVKQRNNT